MAEEENEVTEAPEGGADETKESGSKGSILPWILLGVIVPLCAGAGFGLGRLLAGGGEEVPEEEVVEEPDKPEYMDLLTPGDAGKETWFYQDVDPVVANLADPGATRYIRAGLMLEMSGSFDPTAGKDWLDKQKPLIKNWLALYLASQTVEDLQGERNLNRVLSEIRDLLNERLFPDVAPPIEKVLLSEFAIQ